MSADERATNVGPSAAWRQACFDAFENYEGEPGGDYDAAADAAVRSVLAHLRETMTSQKLDAFADGWSARTEIYELIVSLLGEAGEHV